MMQQEFSFYHNFILPGESVLWQGKPAPGRIITGTDAFLIPFSIFWLGFVIFWEYNVLRMGAPIFFAFFGIPFIAVGLYLLFGRWIHKAIIQKNTAYILTNQKIIRKRGNKIDVVPLADLPPMKVTLHATGNGTLIFSREEYYYNARGNRVSSAPVMTLDNIPDALRVQQLIQQYKTME